jgi:deoxyribodipyrimidine photo-lyase
VIPGGETAGRARLDAWCRGGLARYPEAHDAPALEGTSRLSPYLHLGCLSPVEVARRCAARAGGEAFLRQLCWRDFHHQVTAAFPAITREEYRPRGDRWGDDAALLAAWKAGRTGYPLVDAGMRQLAAEGWMHNRARLVTASFLVKDLGLDWRLGAAHFLDLLVDGDIANNAGNWQWVAGTGNDTRPNRIFNPVRQALRFDPAGAYVRRWVPELARVTGARVHEPWRLDPAERRRLDYPEPLDSLRTPPSWRRADSSPPAPGRRAGRRRA